jgi:hypothetical protein
MARHRTRDTPCFVCLTKCPYVVFGDFTPCYYSGGPYSTNNDEEEEELDMFRVGSQTQTTTQQVGGLPRYACHVIPAMSFICL